MEDSMRISKFLSGHNCPAPISRPAFPNLHTEVDRLWRKPYSVYIYSLQQTNYVKMEELHAHGYVLMPLIDKILAGYLSVRHPLGSLRFCHPSPYVFHHI